MQDMRVVRRAQRRPPLQKSREATARNAPHTLASIAAGCVRWSKHVRRPSTQVAVSHRRPVVMMDLSGCPMSSGEYRGQMLFGVWRSSHEEHLSPLAFHPVALWDSPRRSLAELRRAKGSRTPSQISRLVSNLPLCSPFCCPPACCLGFVTHAAKTALEMTNLGKPTNGSAGAARRSRALSVSFLRTFVVVCTLCYSTLV